ncbi:hypothetical protein BC829DRAFT_417052 [Chytridium lagenaria]|nr:hypothetical protein BC829DRAFT_417052 [Chytridium lagenaria]
MSSMFPPGFTHPKPDEDEDLIGADPVSAAKRKRQTQSCDRCREKKRRCDGLRPCANCTKANAVCTMLVEPKKRGPKRGSDRPNDGEEIPRKQKRQRVDSETEVPDDFKLGSAYDRDRDAFYSANTSLNDSFEESITAKRSPSDIAYQDTLRHSNGNSGLLPLLEEDISNSQQNPSPSFLSPNSGIDEISSTWQVASRSSSLPSEKSMSPRSLWDLRSYAEEFNFDLQQLDSQFLHDPAAAMYIANARNGMGLQSIIKSPSLRFPSPVQLSPDLYDKVVSFSGSVEDALPWSPAKITDTMPHEESAVMGGFLIAGLAGNSWGILSSFDTELLQIFPSKSSYTERAAYFASRAATLIPATASKSFRNFETLFAWSTVMDVHWNGLLAQRLDTAFLNTIDDFFSVYNGKPKAAMVSGIQERKRVWWAAVMIDTYVTLSTGDPFLIYEDDYIETFAGENSLVVMDYWDAKSSINLQDELLSLGFDGRWVDFINRPAAPTVFMDNAQSPRPGVTDTFFAKAEDMHFLVQLSYYVRKIVRFNKGQSIDVSQLFGRTSGLKEALGGSKSRVETILLLHNQLLEWYENLPGEMKFIRNLESLINGTAIIQHPQCQSLPKFALQLNLMVFTALVLLHHRNVHPYLPRTGSPVTGLTFSLSPGSHVTFSSLDMCLIAYRAQCFILRFAYSDRVPPPPSAPPPVHIALAPIIPCLLMPAPCILLEQKDLGALLWSPLAINSTQDGRIESLPSLFLPIMDNLGQIWPIASSYAQQLRQRIRLAMERAHLAT